MPFKGAVPIISQESFVAPNATIVGNVVLGDESGVWYGSVVRGDENAVHIGVLTNIYDNCTVTADCEVSDISIDTDGTGGRVMELPGVTSIGSYVTIAPSCVLRACTVEDNAVVQANSVLCEGSLVESGAVVGAGSVVPPGRRVPAGQLWAGNPVDYVRDITPGEVEEMAAQVKRDLGHLQDHESNCYPVGNPADKSCQPNSKMRGDRAQQDSRPLHQQWDRDPRATC
jgi:carbonic anhydrase/acetyltransferase-like protein (isoleucine patch superfamily)